MLAALIRPGVTTDSNSRPEPVINASEWMVLLGGIAAMVWAGQAMHTRTVRESSADIETYVSSCTRSLT